MGERWLNLTADSARAMARKPAASLESILKSIAQIAPSSTWPFHQVSEVVTEEVVSELRSRGFQVKYIPVNVLYSGRVVHTETHTVISWRKNEQTII